MPLIHPNPTELLTKYMRHVEQAEGTNFVNCLNDHTRSEVKFTDDEVQILKQISAEIDADLWQSHKDQS